MAKLVFARLRQEHMTDSINKNVEVLIKDNINKIQGIVNKFSAVLQDTRPEKDIPYLAYIINVCVNHINQKHDKELSPDWKAWAVVIVRNQYLKGKLKKESEIPKIIDEFVEFLISDYEKYRDNIIAATEYDRDRGFVFKFEKSR